MSSECVLCGGTFILEPNDGQYCNGCRFYFPALGDSEYQDSAELYGTTLEAKQKIEEVKLRVDGGQGCVTLRYPRCTASDLEGSLRELSLIVCGQVVTDLTVHGGEDMFVIEFSVEEDEPDDPEQTYSDDFQKTWD